MSVNRGAGNFRKRRSTVSDDSWSRFRVVFSHHQLDNLSHVFGEFEFEDNLGENLMRCDKRLLVVGESVFGAEQVKDMKLKAEEESLIDDRHLKTDEQKVGYVIAKKALAQQGLQMGTNSEINFEQFLNFVLAYVQVGRDMHPHVGYPSAFARKVNTVMKSHGKISETTKELEIETAATFKILKEIGIDTVDSNVDEQKRVTLEIQRIDMEETGKINTRQLFEMLRSLDTSWEILERRGLNQIIDDTGYSGKDLDNLKVLFDEYAQMGDNVHKYMSVGSFREFLRALKLSLNKQSTAHLKETMKPSFINNEEKIDFSGFCRSMKKLENEDFCGLRALMGGNSKDDDPGAAATVSIPVASGGNTDTRTMSFFERRALMGRK